MTNFFNSLSNWIGISCCVCLAILIVGAIVFTTVNIIKGKFKSRKVSPAFVLFMLTAVLYGGSKAHLAFQKGLVDNNSNPTNGVISWTADVGYTFGVNQFVGLVHSNAETSVVSSNSTTYGVGTYDYGMSVTNDYVWVWWHYPDIDFYFDEYLYDNGSCATPEMVIVKWEYEIVPSYSTLFVDYRKKNSNSTYERLGQCEVSQRELRCNFNGDPRDYEFLVWTSYVPTPTVHTNGVWSGKMYYTKDKSKKLLLDSIIIDHGRVIGTPPHRENYLNSLTNSVDQSN